VVEQSSARSFAHSLSRSLSAASLSLSLSLSLSRRRRRRRCGSVLFCSGVIGVRHLVREGAVEGLRFLGVWCGGLSGRHSAREALRSLSLVGWLVGWLVG